MPHSSPRQPPPPHLDGDGRADLVIAGSTRRCRTCATSAVPPFC